MPVQTNPQSFGPVPLFMSVYDQDTSTQRLEGYPEQHAFSTRAQVLKNPAGSGSTTHSPNSASSAFPIYHRNQDSTSTSASDSDSSPTTTISTTDSASTTDLSPGPSPESPATTVSPSSVVMDTPGFRSMESGRAPLFEMQHPATPARKARNLKNLAVNTTGAFPLGRAVSTASLPLAGSIERTSAPASPTFIKPPTPPRRRPSNLGLTITTPSTSNLPTRLAIPSTPSSQRPNILRHFQSSPSLPLFSPSAVPKEDMGLPPIRGHPQGPLGFAEVPLENDEEESEPNFDVPQSREEKPEAYPHGPICIYESGVDLYLEPTAEVASQYDVVMNVASEVKNPFDVASEAASISEAASTTIRSQQGVQSSVVGVLSNDSLQSESPATPKATPLPTPLPTNLSSNGPALEVPTKPEYIHIPWEHNTDIVPDLYKLVKIIDDRVQQGKRVLVHCQCGVSRSASLIVAYGLYKNPAMSVQEAYDAVKRRSKWIGPNMGLIMQLQEFRSGLLKATTDPAHQNGIYRLNNPSRQLSSNISSGLSSGKPGAAGSSSVSRTLRTAPLLADSDTSPQRASTGNMVPLSAGPVTAPSALFWEPGYRNSWTASQSTYDVPVQPVPAPSETPYVDAKGHVVPVFRVVQTQQAPVPLLDRNEAGNLKESSTSKVASSSLMSPRSTEFHMAPLVHNASHDDFGILSPLTAGFPGNPFLAPPPLQRLQHKERNKAETNPSVSFSPRSTEFAMTAITHQVSEDDFGIFSPIATEFSSNSFDRSGLCAGSNHEVKNNVSLPHRPAHQPQAHKPQAHTTLVKSSDTVVPRGVVGDDAGMTSSSGKTLPLSARSPTSPTQPVRSKSSSLATDDQLRLHKLQTEIKSQLSSRSSSSPSQEYGIDALMSPRATEFILNPFHTALSPAPLAPARPSSASAFASAEPRDTLPVAPAVMLEKKSEDPRSPAQVGISPITRNIWDVLE